MLFSVSLWIQFNYKLRLKMNKIFLIFIYIYIYAEGVLSILAIIVENVKLSSNPVQVCIFHFVKRHEFVFFLTPAKCK